MKVTVNTPAGSFIVENQEPATVASFLELAGVHLDSMTEVHGPNGRLAQSDVIEQDEELYVSKTHSNA